MKLHRFVVVGLVLLQGATLAAASQLSGTISTEDGKPLAGATVRLWTAAMKTGTSIFCPSCYADCAKSGKTDAAGRFVIENLDPQLIFRVLVVREDFVPQFVKDVNPDKTTMSVSLKAQPKDIPEANILRGKVVDRKGNAIEGATVTPFGAQDGKRRFWGPTDDLADPLAVSNENGEFALIGTKPNLSLDLQVEARGYAVTNFALQPIGQVPVKLAIGEGATIYGRLVDRDGKPIADAMIGCAQSFAGPEVSTGHHEIGTDKEGNFNFPNLGPPGDYVVFATMSSMEKRGTPRFQKVRVGIDGTKTDTITLTADSAFGVRGQVVLSDGKPVPSGTRVLLGRDEAWDSLQTDCDAEGKFHFAAVPAGEKVSIYTRVKGYHTSTKNKSYEPLNAMYLKGIVDQDITGLRLLLEPGPDQRPTLDELRSSKFQEMSQRVNTTRIGGVEGTDADPH